MKPLDHRVDGGGIEHGGVVFDAQSQFVTGQGAGTVAGKFGGANHWVQPRAPINVNTVTREVLVSILWGLTASFVDYDHPTGTLKVRAVSISKPQAEAAADYIINARYTHGDPAGAWGYNDWMHFRHDVIDVMHESPGAFLDKFQTALIHANFNPNTEIKKLNPDMRPATSLSPPMISQRKPRFRVSLRFTFQSSMA